MPSTVRGSGFLLITGQFVVEGLSPDGDTVAFKPNDPALASQLEDSKALVVKLQKSKHGTFSLRYEAIDTPETHYPSPVKGLGEGWQPVAAGDGATDANLKLLGFPQVAWSQKKDGRRGKVKATVSPRPGYILARASDGRNGRAVAFLFTGRAPAADGRRVHVTADMVNKSVNYQLLLQGWAYPTYYDGLFGDLRDEFTKAAKAARKARRGVWKVDRTRSGFDYKAINPFDPPTGGQVILPKLYRRLYQYSSGHPSLAGFADWLRKGDDSVIPIQTVHKQPFAVWIKSTKNKIQLTIDPEQLIFVPKG